MVSMISARENSRPVVLPGRLMRPLATVWWLVVVLLFAAVVLGLGAGASFDSKKCRISVSSTTAHRPFASVLWEASPRSIACSRRSKMSFLYNATCSSPDPDVEGSWRGRGVDVAGGVAAVAASGAAATAAATIAAVAVAAVMVVVLVVLSGEAVGSWDAGPVVMRTILTAATITAMKSWGDRTK